MLPSLEPEPVRISPVITLPTVRKHLVRDIIDKASEFGLGYDDLDRLRRRLERWSELSLERLLRKMDLLDPFMQLFELTTDGMHQDRISLRLEAGDAEQMSCEQKLIRLRTLDRYLGYPYRDVSRMRRSGDIEEVIAELEEELLLPFDHDGVIEDLQDLERELGLNHLSLTHKRLDDVLDRIDHLMEARAEGRFRPRTAVNYAPNGAPIMGEEAASA